eukprot:7771277-Pyramimonas_sp.AAC.1
MGILRRRILVCGCRNVTARRRFVWAGGGTFRGAGRDGGSGDDEWRGEDDEDSGDGEGADDEYICRLDAILEAFRTVLSRNLVRVRLCSAVRRARPPARRRRNPINPKRKQWQDVTEE